MGLKKHVRSLFLSDVHLGSPHCHTSSFLSFLDSVKADKVYLVGDTIDFDNLYEQHGWAAECNLIIRKLLSKVKKGAQVKLCVGNHDALIGILSDFKLGDIEVARSFVHRGHFNDYLVVHGDEFDKSMKFLRTVKFLSLVKNHMGSSMIIRWLQRIVDGLAERNVDYEAIASFVKKKELNGCIMGHVHRPTDKMFVKGVHIINCGDWVEHDSAVVEELDGELKLVYFKGQPILD